MTASNAKSGQLSAKLEAERKAARSPTSRDEERMMVSGLRAGRIYATSAGRTVVMVLMCRIAGSGIRGRAYGLEGMS